MPIVQDSADIFDAPEWFEALTLAERAALVGVGEDPPSPEQAERAARKLRRWREESEMLDDALFAERLAFEGLTPDQVLRILAEPAEGLRRRAGGLPDWLRTLERAFSQLAAFDGGLGILELLRPLIADARSRLLEALRRIEGIDPEALLPGLLDTLLRRLRWASERTLVLELHVSRLEGRLQGDTPEERFESFVASLNQPETALEILRRYPVLARDAVRHAEQWIETSLEMMERFAADRGEVVRRLAAGEDPGPVVSVETGLSDRHAGGRSVAILAFASGFRVVYKPKPLAVDLQFQELVAWLNQHGADPPLKTLTILDQGLYGWMEYVSAQPCSSVEEVARFHERQGAWVALFYVLEATDFHHENLIAAGGHPVPIDLETLLQPELADLTATGPGSLPMANTVLRSGLLPRRFGENAAHEGLDLSGMGAVVRQSLEVKRITDEGTDRMRWASARTEMEAGPNTPTLNGEPVALWDQGEMVLRGFQKTLRRLRALREELLAPEGPLAAFSGLPLRTLLRGTSIYAHLLHVGHHPDYLRSGLDRDRLYDRLWLDAIAYPPLRRAVPAERFDLLAGDIPRFEVLPSSIDLLHGGWGRIKGYFGEPGLDLVRKRIREMDEDDLERQSWLVRASIEATRPMDMRRGWESDPLPDAPPAGPERFLAAARRIGDRLAQLAVVQGDFVSWFHIDATSEGWRFEPMPLSLYSGLSGIALFFAHLARRTGDERFERMARLAVTTLRRRLEEDRRPLRCGAFDGLGGIVYTFTHLGLLWDEPALLDEAEALVPRLSAALESDEIYDLIGGAAGGAAALLALHRHRPSASTLQAAALCGEHLLARAIHSERGTAWPPIPGVSELPLTGFGHGTAGIAWALASLTEATGDERFRDAAREAIAYERSWFSPERGSWPDLRESRATEEGRPFFYAWCHGAPGIGLGRIGSLSSLEDPEMLEEIQAAARSTLAEGFGFNHSLCHGDLGNLELIREAGRVLGDPELMIQAEHLAARILTRIESEGPRCGASARSEIPGLMTGLAGIGYGLLRVVDPEVPSVLLLETQGQGLCPTMIPLRRTM